MRYTSKTVKKLSDHYREISLLEKVNALLDWDLNVNLPQKAASSRAEQRAYITKLISDKWLSEDFRNILQKANAINNLSEEEKAVLRNLNHASKYYHRVPQKIIIEFTETTSKAFMAWREAREKNDFTIFEPHLKKIISLNQTIAQHMGFKDNPYDALLDMYEPGLTAKVCGKIFTTLTKEIGSLLKEIKKSNKYLYDSNLLENEYPIAKQQEIAEFILQKIGYDFSAGRQDVSPHPFTTELGEGDIRVTNRYSPHNFIESIMVALHEGGHALYEQGVNPKYTNTPLEGGVSLGIHESQSRFWENQIGRSHEFVAYIEPILRAFYPKQLQAETVDSLFLDFNKVFPQNIRVEADEVTYNLHIALRFELEEALINEKINTKNLPEEWNGKMKKYLGIVPDSDTNGVLQDVHWSYGSFGYFPTYTLGNLYAAQFSHFMNKKLDTKKLIRNGDFETILSWQRQNIHETGSLYWPNELVEIVTGKALSEKYFVNYLKAKYQDIYN